MIIYQNENSLAFVFLNKNLNIDPATQVPTGKKFKILPDSIVESIDPIFWSSLEYDIENDYDGIGTRGSN